MTFLGLSPDVVNKIVEGKIRKTQLPTGAVEVSAVAQEKERLKEASQSGMQIGQLNPEQRARIIQDAETDINPFNKASAIGGGIVGARIAAPYGAALGAPGVAIASIPSALS